MTCIAVWSLLLITCTYRNKRERERERRDLPVWCMCRPRRKMAKGLRWSDRRDNSGQPGNEKLTFHNSIDTTKRRSRRQKKKDHRWWFCFFVLSGKKEEEIKFDFPPPKHLCFFRGFALLLKDAVPSPKVSYGGLVATCHRDGPDFFFLSCTRSSFNGNRKTSWYIKCCLFCLFPPLHVLYSFTPGYCLLCV